MNIRLDKLSLTLVIFFGNRFYGFKIALNRKEIGYDTHGNAGKSDADFQ
jgi:hypothetical protein